LLSSALASPYHYDAKVGVYRTPLDLADLFATLTTSVFFGALVMLYKLTQLWRDWSASGGSLHILLLLEIPAVFMLVVPLAINVQVALASSNWMLLALIAGGLIVLIPFLMIRRWRAMMRAPVPWPAGRR
jgi:hypothetical protein